MPEAVRAVVTGTGRYVPERTMTSEEVERAVNFASGERLLGRGAIRVATGVIERRYASTEMSSDLAIHAARDALASAQVDPNDVDLVIFAAASHDIAEPATANIVQHALGCDRAAGLDIKNACNSFINALDVAAALIATERARTVLVTAGERLSPTIKWAMERAELSKGVAALTLGDGGGACVVRRSTKGTAGLLPGSFVSLGGFWECSTVLAGGTRWGFEPSRGFFESDSGTLQRLAVEYIPPLVRRALATAGWATDDVRLVVPHQVTASVIKRIASVVGIPAERCVITLDRYGNTAAASIPIALDVAIDEGRVVPGDKVLLVGGAAGFSAGVVPVVL